MALSIDQINRLSSRASREQFKSFLRDRKLGVETAALTASFALYAMNGFDSNAIAMMVGASLGACSKSVIQAYKEAMKFGSKYRMEMLENTSEFKDCQLLYDNYVRKIAEFMRCVGVKDSLDVGMLYMELLYNGAISLPGYFQYHKYNSDYDMCSSLMGARVTSGQAVCRHIASNLIDVYREMGHSAAYLSVKGVSDENKAAMTFNRVMPFRTTHAVSLVGDRNRGKYILDPTWMTVAVFRKNSDVARIIYNSKGCPLYLIDFNGTVEYEKNTVFSEYAECRHLSDARFYKGEIRNARDTAHDFYYKHRHGLIRDFRRYIFPELSDIAELERILSDYKDVPLIDDRRYAKRRG